MEITYKDLVKKVHPDLNPNIKDPGEKIAKIMANKNNPSILMDLAIKWGLIEGPKKKPTYDYTNYSSDWKVFDFIKSGKVPNGVKIKFKTSKGWKEAFYVTRTRTKIFLTDLKGFFSINKTFEQLNGKISFNPYEYLTEKQRLYWKNIIIKNTGSKEKPKSFINKYFGSKITDHWEVFSHLHMRQNKTYRYEDVYVAYRGYYYKVLRTNERSVFIDHFGTEKRIQLKTISHVRFGI